MRRERREGRDTILTDKPTEEGECFDGVAFLASAGQFSYDRTTIQKMKTTVLKNVRLTENIIASRDECEGIRVSRQCSTGQPEHPKDTLFSNESDIASYQDPYQAMPPLSEPST